jgi:hypothetical protein
MVRSTAIPLLILAGMALTPTEVGAASITYSIVNYPKLQNGYTVTGTITTNGTTGTQLPTTDITSWDITISLGTIQVVHFTPTNFIIPDSTFDATTTTIMVASPATDIRITNFPNGNVNLAWANTGSTIRYGANLVANVLWSSNNLPSTTPIATVPEPSSAVLASIGAVVAFLAYGWSRHRRAQRRQAAA